MSFDERFDERKGKLSANNVSLLERGWGDIQPVPLVWNLEQQAKAAQGYPGQEPERGLPPEREPWGLRDKARYRNFSVDIYKAKSVPLGLQVRPLDGSGLEVVKVHEASPVEEWNRMCAGTFPDDVLRAGDIITKKNEMPTKNGMQNVLLIVVRRF